MNDRATARILAGPLPFEVARFGTPLALGMGLQVTFNLVDAYLIAYKRGYAGYRSDAVPTGGPRSDFTVRHNRVELRDRIERMTDAAVDLCDRRRCAIGMREHRTTAFRQ